MKVVYLIINVRNGKMNGIEFSASDMIKEYLEKVNHRESTEKEVIAELPKILPFDYHQIDW